MSQACARGHFLSPNAAPAAVQGYHVSRLAADLRDFLDALDLQVNFNNNAGSMLRIVTCRTTQRYLFGTRTARIGSSQQKSSA